MFASSVTMSRTGTDTHPSRKRCGNHISASVPCEWKISGADTPLRVAGKVMPCLVAVSVIRQHFSSSGWKGAAMQDSLPAGALQGAPGQSAV